MNPTEGCPLYPLRNDAQRNLEKDTITHSVRVWNVVAVALVARSELSGANPHVCNITAAWELQLETDDNLECVVCPADVFFLSALQFHATSNIEL